jgi:galacturan 1,4-alpha-galacturonidase
MKILGLTSVFLGLPGVFAHLASPGTVQLSERPSLQPHPKQQPTPHLISSPRNKTCVVGSGAEDAAPAILEAAEACNNGGVVVFPANESYTIGTALNLTFLKSVDFDIQGHITVRRYPFGGISNSSEDTDSSSV